MPLSFLICLPHLRLLLTADCQFQHTWNWNLTHYNWILSKPMVHYLQVLKWWQYQCKCYQGLNIVEWTLNIVLHPSDSIKFDVTYKCPGVQDLAVATCRLYLHSRTPQKSLNVRLLLLFSMNECKCSKVTVSIGPGVIQIFSHLWLPKKRIHSKRWFQIGTLDLNVSLMVLNPRKMTTDHHLVWVHLIERKKVNLEWDLLQTKLVLTGIYTNVWRENSY